VPLTRKVAQPLLRPRALCFSKVRSFSCAPWKRVRIFEGIVGVFQDAHFPKWLRIFESGAHLRRLLLEFWSSKFCVIGEICGSSFRPRITRMSLIKQQAAPAFIREIRGLALFLTEHDHAKDTAQ
jgi:hypothetical protein